MSVYILSALLLTILAYAIYQLSKKSEVETEIKKLKQQSEASLLEELSSATMVMNLCFAAGLLLTANYAITTFSGAELRHIDQWGGANWAGAVLGLFVTVSITLVQRQLYSSTNHSKAGLVVTTLILTFVIVSEIGAPMEKEEMKMRSSSENSAVYKAAINGATGGAGGSSIYSSQLAHAQEEKASHEFELTRCERHKDKGVKRVERCENFEKKAIAVAQAKIESYQSSAQADSDSNQANNLAFLSKAKELAQNTDNHSALVKLTASVLGAGFLPSMMLLSLVLIVAFEAGFHFVGSRVGLLKSALGEMGNKDVLYAQELKRLKRDKKFEDEKQRLKTGFISTKKTDKTDSSNDSKSANDAGFLGAPVPVVQFSGTELQPANDASQSHIEKRNDDRVELDIHGVSEIEANANIDRVPTVSETVGTRSNDDEKDLLTINEFDDLYDYIVMKIKAGSVKPTVRPMRKIAHAFIKENTTLNPSDISFPKSNKLMQDVIDKMLKDEIITINPEHKNGTAKYAVNKDAE